MSNTSEWQYYVDGHPTSDHDLMSRANELNRLYPLKLDFPARLPLENTPAEAARILREHGHIVESRSIHTDIDKSSENAMKMPKLSEIVLPTPQTDLFEKKQNNSKSDAKTLRAELLEFTRALEREKRELRSSLNNVFSSPFNKELRIDMSFFVGNDVVHVMSSIDQWEINTKGVEHIKWKAEGLYFSLMSHVENRRRELEKLS